MTREHTGKVQSPDLKRTNILPEPLVRNVIKETIAQHKLCYMILVW